jgi:hypothetical protein
MKVMLLSLLLLTAGCRRDQPPAPTSEESQQLNEAEDMLNAMAENEEGPEAHASDPPGSQN